MEHPILFSTPMVQAILDGRKTMTRRVLKVQPPNDNYKILTIMSTTGDKRIEGKHHWAVLNGLNITDDQRIYFKCPYGQVGDRLWVREAWAEGMNVPVPAIYKADKEWTDIKIKWKPSIFMPRWASRITLEITNIRVERLQEITEEDCKKEGIELKCWKMWRPPDTEIPYTRRDHFEALWDFINGKKYPWSSNPWVWVVEFKKLNMAA